MNIFRLDENPIKAARFYVDSHVVKIPTEIAQVLANLFTKERLSHRDCPRTKTGNIRKYSHYNHPISKWLRESVGNIHWTIIHGLELCNEYNFRYGKNHFSRGFIDWAFNHLGEINIQEREMTEQPQCFSEYTNLVVKGNPVKGYRNYYTFGKKHLHKWKKRNKPNWIK